MPTLDFVSEFIHENCENVTEKNGKFHCRCPLCGDSQKSSRKKRFHLTFYSEDKIIFNCFNCNSSGTFTKLYAFVKGMDEKDAYKELHGFNAVMDRFVRVKNNKLKKEDKELIGTVDYRLMLEKDCVCENTNPIGYTDKIASTFLKKFREERDVPKDVKLWFCLNGDFKYRIIIPIHDKKGRIVYFQGRAVSPKQEPKYLNPATPKSIIIPNVEKLNNEKPIVIPEGLLDSYSVSNGTTCLGKHISDEFLKEIFKINEKVIIAFDNDDAGTQARNKLFKESRVVDKLKFFLFPKNYKKYKDLNEIKVKEHLNIEEMDNLIIQNSFDFKEFNIRKECMGINV